jgi:hypothetical protein
MSVNLVYPALASEPVLKKVARTALHQFLLRGRVDTSRLVEVILVELAVAGHHEIGTGCLLILVVLASEIVLGRRLIPAIVRTGEVPGATVQQFVLETRLELVVKGLTSIFDYFLRLGYDFGMVYFPRFLHLRVLGPTAMEALHRHRTDAVFLTIVAVDVELGGGVPHEGLFGVEHRFLETISL